MTAGTCLVAMYHYVRDAERTEFPAIKALAIADFNTQLDWLQDAYRVVDYATFADDLCSRSRSSSPSALLTFDDGLVDHFETVMPALAAKGMSGVFFLSGVTVRSAPRLLNVHKAHFLLAVLGAEMFAAELREELARESVEAPAALGWRQEVYRYDATAELSAKHLLNYELPLSASDRILSALFAKHLGDEVEFARRLYLSREAIREMAAAGMTFGFHTETHPVLARLLPDEQREELVGGVELIRELTGQQSVPFCYPYGHSHTYDAATLQILADAGYSMAFNTSRRHVCFDSDDRYELPRFDTRDLPPFANAHDAKDAKETKVGTEAKSRIPNPESRHRHA